MSLLREGAGDRRCPAIENEEHGKYLARLGEFLKANPEAQPVVMTPPPSDARLPYRERDAGEDEEPWVPMRTVTREDLAVGRSKAGPWEER